MCEQQQNYNIINNLYFEGRGFTFPLNARSIFYIQRFLNQQKALEAVENLNYIYGIAYSTRLKSFDTCYGLYYFFTDANEIHISTHIPFTSGDRNKTATILNVDAEGTLLLLFFYSFFNDMFYRSR